jgi:hypothetical protein
LTYRGSCFTISVPTVTDERLKQGKPVARRGRKARDLIRETAQLPVRQGGQLVFRNPSHSIAVRVTWRVWLLAGLCAAAFAGASAASASAALISTGACDASTLRQPFLKWGDSNRYKLVPGGDFESSLAGWTLKGGAAKTPGSEPFRVTGSAGASSILLPPGASVQSPFTCVNAGYPAFRFFGRNNGLLSTVLVQVIYQNPVLGLVPIPVGVVALSGSWQPTLRMLTASLVGGLLSGGTAQISLRFTALTGSSQIDDIYVDPRMKL